MYAIIETGGKQIKVEAGQEIYVEKLGVAADEIVTFDKVLFTSTGSDANVGKPYVAGATVQGKVLKQGRGAKIHVLKYRPKSKYRRKIGARQAFTEVEITKI